MSSAEDRFYAAASASERPSRVKLFLVAAVAGLVLGGIFIVFYMGKVKKADAEVAALRADLEKREAAVTAQLQRPLPAVVVEPSKAEPQAAPKLTPGQELALRERVRKVSIYVSKHARSSFSKIPDVLKAAGFDVAEYDAAFAPGAMSEELYAKALSEFLFREVPKQPDLEASLVQATKDTEAEMLRRAIEWDEKHRK